MTPIDRERVCLVSGADEIRLRSYIGHSIYAQLHGFDFRLECGMAPGVKNKFFYKTSILRRVLAKYDWVVWLDDDVFITDFASDSLASLIEKANGSGHHIVIAEGPLEPNGFWSVVNTGVMLLKNSPETHRLLDSMTDEQLTLVQREWDASSMGTYTGGDQDIVTWWAKQPENEGLVRIVGHRELNSRGHYYQNSLTDAFAMHFCGYPDKALGVTWFAERFHIGQEIVPQNLLDDFSVKVRSPMGAPEKMVRNARFRMTSRVRDYVKPEWRNWIKGVLAKRRPNA